MYCPKCGKSLSKDALYCQWCGKKLSLIDPDTIVERIKELRQPHELEVAGLIATIWRTGAYKKQYRSFEDFGWDQLGMDKSIMFKYKDVGMKFLDEDGNPLIPDAEQWGIGKLTIMLNLEFNEISYLREKGFIDPNMRMQDLRKMVNVWKERKKA